MPEGQMRCRFRLRNVYRRKSYFMLRNALSRYTSSGGIRRHLPLGGEGYSVRGRTFNSPRFDLSALCDLYPILPLIPHAVVVSPP